MDNSQSESNGQVSDLDRKQKQASEINKRMSQNIEEDQYESNNSFNGQNDIRVAISPNPVQEILNSFLQKIKSRRYWTPIGVFIYNLSKILLTLGLAALAGFYAFAVTSAMPVLFGGGIVLAVVFGFYTISTGISWFKKPNRVEDEFDAKSIKIRPAYFRSFGTVLLGAALIALGVLLLVAQPFMGVLLGVGLAVKIGLIVAGALFAAKGISDGIIQTRQPEGKLKNLFARVPHFLLNIAPVVLGILAIIFGISTGILYLPIAIAVIFAMRCTSHVLRALSKSTRTEEEEEAGKLLMQEQISSQSVVLNQYQENNNFDEKENEEQLASINDDKLNSQNKCMKVACVLDNLSLMAIGGGLIVAGALFAAPLAAAISIPVLFAKISLLVIGSLSALMGLTKFFIGPMIELWEDRINLITSSSGSESNEIHENNDERGDSFRQMTDGQGPSDIRNNTENTELINE